MALIDAANPLTRWLPADRAGWVSAIPLSLVVVVGALLSVRSHVLLRHDRELVVHSFEVIRAADEVPEHLLAVLRETLSNTARHAKATGVDIDLTADGTTITLTIADNGIGITPGNRHSGLTNLHTRATQLGGTCTIKPHTTGGTIITWHVPQPNEPATATRPDTNKPNDDQDQAESP